MIHLAMFINDKTAQWSYENGLIFNTKHTHT